MYLRLKRDLYCGQKNKIKDVNRERWTIFLRSRQNALARKDVGDRKKKKYGIWLIFIMRWRYFLLHLWTLRFLRKLWLYKTRNRHNFRYLWEYAMQLCCTSSETFFFFAFKRGRSMWPVSLSLSLRHARARIGGSKSLDLRFVSFRFVQSGGLSFYHNVIRWILYK